MCARVRGLLLAATVVAALLVPAASPALAQETAAVSPALREQALKRFQVLLLRDGVVLTPRRGAGQSIEISRGSIAVDGAIVTGDELRARLGDDAETVLQLSYVSPQALREAFGPPAPPAAPVPPLPDPPAAPGAPAAEAAPAPPAPPQRPERDRWRRRSGTKVNMLGSITVEQDERVGDEVVAILGSVRVLGRVDGGVVAVGGSVTLGPEAYVAGDVVAVGGSVSLGPNAVVTGEVTSVGGRIRQEPGAEVRGAVNEIAMGMGPFGHVPGPWGGAHEAFTRPFRLAGTLLRVALVLLLALVLFLVFSRPIERIARRAGDEPVLSGFVGLLAQIFFFPLLILTIVVLAVSIIGIPLLLLVPFALVAALVAVLVGFAGVDQRVGRWAVGPWRSGMVATAVGVVLIAAVTILARTIGLLPGPFAAVGFAVMLVGLFVEYVAWTVGLGATILTRFGTVGPLMPAPEISVVPPPVPPPIPASDPPGL
jgi:hypothetical protein